jgi:hypothetical protein
MHLTVIGSQLEGTMVKVLARSAAGDPDVTVPPLPPPITTTTTPQQLGGAAGASQAQDAEDADAGPTAVRPARRPRDVVVFLQSKASHAFDLAPGQPLTVHAPWHEVDLGGGPPAVLAHLLTQPSGLGS